MNVHYFEGIGIFNDNQTDMLEIARVSQLRKAATFNANALELAYALGQKLNQLPEPRGRKKFDPETFNFRKRVWDSLGKNGRHFCRMLAEIPERDLKAILAEARTNDSRNKRKDTQGITEWDTGNVISKNEMMRRGEEYKIKRLQAADARQQAVANRKYFGAPATSGQKGKTTLPKQKQELAYQKLCRIEHGKFQEKLKSFEGLPVHPNEKPVAIITDPPYLQKHFDSNLWKEFAEWSLKHLAKNGVLVVMVGNLWLARAISTLVAAGWEYRWTLAVRYKWGKPVHAAKANPFWKPIVVFRRKGDKSRKGDYIKNDAFTVGADMFDAGKRNKKDGEWQQDVETFERLVDYFTRPGDLVVDPFVGYGTTPIACIKHARRFVGSEKLSRRWKKADRKARAEYRRMQTRK